MYNIKYRWPLYWKLINKNIKKFIFQYFLSLSFLLFWVTTYIIHFIFQSIILFRVFWSVKIKFWTSSSLVISTPIYSLSEWSSKPTFCGIPLYRLYHISQFIHSLNTHNTSWTTVWFFFRLENFKKNSALK